MLDFGIEIDYKEGGYFLNEEIRKNYFDKIESLKLILLDEFIPEEIFERDFQLETGKSDQQDLGRKKQDQFN